MILIIAEKPSLARNIASALAEGTNQHEKKGNGCITVGSYIITWAFGHLFALSDIEYYKPAQNKLSDGRVKWSLDNLPCFPREFHYELRRPERAGDDGAKRQFAIIRELCRRPDVDTIVNAGDSDREGEIIVRLCIKNAFDGHFEDCGKRLCRLWLPDQTADTIRSAVAELKEEKEYDCLADEGFARTFIDWLYGVNLTRFATLKSGTLLRVGRVIVPIVKAIYDRDLAIRNFKPETYFSLSSAAETNGEVVELNSKLKFDTREAAEAICRQYNELGASVLSVKKKKDKLNPGKLYSLTKLQNFLGKKYKMSMPDSLAVVQSLYEKGYVTYPRTNSEYLATAEKEKVKKILGMVTKLGYPVTFKDSKSIFDDSKIESHSALTPTTKAPDKTKMTADEAKVYGAIIRRFVAVFCAEDCLIDKTEIVVRVGEPPETGEDFTLKGTVILSPGWTKYDDYNGKDKVLPPLKKGDAVTVDFKPCEKQTTPPKHYTIETLNNYLKNPFREDLQKKPDEEDDAEEYRAIFEGLELGTEATRTPIIDNARKSKYIELKKDVYTILPDGEFLIESLSRMKIGMDKYKTAELGKALKKVFRGEMTISESTAVAEKEISEVFSQIGNAEDDGFAGDLIGKCPLCGSDVKRTRFGYGCAGYQKNGCRFSVSGQILGQTVSVANMKKLLAGEKTDVIEGFLSKKGTRFAARLKLENGKAVFDFDGVPRMATQSPPEKKKEPTLRPDLPIDMTF